MAGGKHLLGKPKGKHIFGTAKVGEKGQTGIIVTKPEVIEKAAMKIFEEMEREAK